MSPSSAAAVDALAVTLWALACGVLAVLAALALARLWWQTRTALQHSRSEAHALAGLLDVWQWRTDAQHRLTLWRAPLGSPPPLLSISAPMLWAHFAPAHQSAPDLRALVLQQSPIHSMTVHRLNAQGLPQACVIEGVPLLDHLGQFRGHMGTARDVAPSVQALLTEILDALPTPVLHVLAPGAGLLPTLLASNAAASPWIGGVPAGADVKTLPWAEVLQRVPALLRPAIEHAVNHPDAPPLAPVDGWRLHVHQQETGSLGTLAGHTLLLVFQRIAHAAPTQNFNAQQDDQESFSYTVSHDLRAPIRVVEGFTKIVKEDYGRLLDRVGNDHLDRVLGAASRMNSMIDSLLALSQLSARPLSRQPVNLSQLAGYILDDLRRQSPEREVQVQIEPGLIAHGDATLLRVVLENLLGNAWKYSSKCPNARIWFESSVHEGRPAFTVRDNGAGFDMRFADRLFGVFQRLHSANDFQGTGVGLASVRRIVRRHGGDIWAEGEVDRGARFQFWIQE